MDEIFNFLNDVTKLENEPLSYWANILEKYFVSAPMITLAFISSVKMFETLAQKEEARIAEQIARLGPHGLKQKEMKIRKAEEDEVCIAFE